MENKIKVQFLASMCEVFPEDMLDLELEKVTTIQDLLIRLSNTYERHNMVFDVSGELKKNIAVLKNGRNIFSLNGIDTKLEAGDLIVIHRIVFGG